MLEEKRRRDLRVITSIPCNLTAHGCDAADGFLSDWWGQDPNSPENLLDEDYDPSPSTSQLTHRKDRRRSVSRTKDTVVVPEKRSKFKIGQHVILTDDKGQEVGKGTIHLVKGVWSGKNLVESSSYVVDVEELMKSAAQSVCCEIKMLWNSSQLVLIQQQLP
uniref:Nodulin homeobox C-terminal domain-containing protein n=1 Tax=Helianthus annuus TaxID=4232 RepID=A0A251RZP3_HELAN